MKVRICLPDGSKDVPVWYIENEGLIYDVENCFDRTYVITGPTLIHNGKRIQSEYAQKIETQELTSLPPPSRMR